MNIELSLGLDETEFTKSGLVFINVSNCTVLNASNAHELARGRSSVVLDYGTTRRHAGTRTTLYAN